MKFQFIYASLLSGGLISSCGGHQELRSERGEQVKTTNQTENVSLGNQELAEYEIIEIDLGDHDLPLNLGQGTDRSTYINGRDLPAGNYLLNLDQVRGLSLNLSGATHSNKIISLRIEEDGSAMIQEAVELPSELNLTHDTGNGSHGQGSHMLGNHISADYQKKAYGSIGGTVSSTGTMVSGGFFKGSTVISAFGQKDVSVNHGFNYFIGGTLSKAATTGFANDFRTQVAKSYYNFGGVKSAGGVPDNFLKNILPDSEISPFKAASIQNTFTIASQNGWLQSPDLFDPKSGALTQKGNSEFQAQLGTAEAKWKGGGMLKINGRVKFIAGSSIKPTGSSLPAQRTLMGIPASRTVRR